MRLDWGVEEVVEIGETRNEMIGEGKKGREI